MEKLKLRNKLTAFFCLLIFASNAQEMQLIDKIIGVVGDEIILLSDHKVQKSELISRGAAGPELDCLVMENLLYEKLMLNQAKIDSIEIPDEQVELELEQRMLYFTQQFGSEEKLEEFYGKSVEKIKAEFRTLLKDQMLTQRMQSRLTATAYVTPADVEDFFNAIPKDSLPLIGSEVELAHIVIEPEPSKEEMRRAEERANQLRKDVLAGKDFALVATLYSDDPGSAAKGGDLGEARKGMMVSEFEAMAYNLDIGEVSPVFETDFGFHFMQLVDRRGEIYRSSHVLIKPEISQEDISGSITLLDSIADLIVSDSLTFKEAAKKYSDDEDSKFSSGVILNPSTRSVRFAVQDVDPQMFFVIDKLGVGEISEPVILQNPDGSQAFRILKLNARTDPHQANMVDDYQLIQEMARQEISQKSVKDWVNSTVKRTYIRIGDQFNTCSFDNQWTMNEN
ncbi:MAG: peptidylprolyl isomerase [Bacteroidota bacterium]